MSVYAPGLLVELALRAEQVNRHLAVPGHDLILVPEEFPGGSDATYGVDWRIDRSEDHPVMRGEVVRGGWGSPWIRARCSCGWKAKKKDRFTIDDNAVHFWREYHIKGEVGHHG